MLPDDHFASFIEAINELLAAHADKLEGANTDALVNVVMRCIFNERWDRAEANLRELDEWLVRHGISLRPRPH